jgi:hypothetical protein
MGAERREYAFVGNTFYGTSFGDGHSAADRRRTWADELKRAERSWFATGTEMADPVFDAACSQWDRFRIVALRYQRGERPRAEKLMRRIVYWASGAEPSRKLLSTSNELTLSLRDLAAPETWPQEHRGSLVYLARRDDPHTARFFSISNDVEVRGLQERLEKTDIRLVVSLAAAGDTTEGALDPFDDSVCTLEVSAARPPERPERSDEPESGFDQVPRIVVGLFPGLGIAEYQKLVTQILPALAPSAQPGARAADSMGGSSAARPLSRHERWIAGEVDQVLAELDIRYETGTLGDPSPLADQRPAGYYLASETSPYADPGWIVTTFPALLVNHMDALLDRYLQGNGSPRFQEAFLTCLVRTDSVGVRPVTPQWLMQGWRTSLETQADADLITRQVCSLAIYLHTGDQAAESGVVHPLIAALAVEAADLETRFQRELAPEPLREALCHFETRDPPDPMAVWESLQDNPAAQAAVANLGAKQAAALWAVLRLSRDWPEQGAQALAEALRRVTSPVTPWRASGATTQLDLVPRFAALNLDHLLSHLLEQWPELWASVAQGVAQVYGGVAAAVMAGEPASRQTPARQQAASDGQRLALALLTSLESKLWSDHADEMQLLRTLCFSMGDTACDCALLGRLLAMSCVAVDKEMMLGGAGEGTPSSRAVVRFFRKVAFELQGDEELTRDQVDEALTRLGSGLRAVLPPKARRALVEQTRLVLESQSGQYDYFERTGNRAELAAMRKHVRASRAVLRNLGAGK